MAKVYTTAPGDVRRIGNHGEATNDTPAEVPADVAAELAGHPAFRVEAEATLPAPKLTAAALKKAQPKQED